MSAAKYDLEIEQGATLRRVIVWRDPAGAAINLTGARVLFQVRDNPDAVSTHLAFDSAALATGMTIGPLNDTGTIDFTVSNAITALLDFTVGSWDLLVQSAGGQRDRVLEGRATLKLAVTR